MLKEKMSTSEALNKSVNDIVTNRVAINKAKKMLSQNGITGGVIENLLSNPEMLDEMDQREVAVIIDSLHRATNLLALDPQQWYTTQELKTARTYDRRIQTEIDKDMEIQFNNVTMVDDKVFTTTISIEEISDLMDAQMLYYDYNIQRQSTRVKGGINRKATVYRKNVREITDKLLKKKLKPTAIVFNATVGSSESAEELHFDYNTNTLTVAKDARLAILDGYHRCLSSIEAHKANPELKFNFILMVTNYTTREAQEWQADHAKATPIPKARIQMFESNRHADSVTQALMSDSELKDRIAEQHRVSRKVGELVSYNVLTDAIEREFPMEFRRDTERVSQYLKCFFDEFVAEFSQELLGIDKNKNSLISYNKMFAGYVALAAKMQEKTVPLGNLRRIIMQVDFSRDNPLWKEINVLDNEGNISSKSSERNIAEYFRSLV